MVFVIVGGELREGEGGEDTWREEGDLFIIGIFIFGLKFIIGIWGIGRMNYEGYFSLVINDKWEGIKYLPYFLKLRWYSHKCFETDRCDLRTDNWCSEWKIGKLRKRGN